ncbi:MAG: phenylacetate--CoA ligase [Spirochaetia bacterium]|jgi:phenylacetate-CoA ligase
MIWNQKYETMTRDQMDQVQLERLQATLHRTERNVAFYRQSFSGHGVKSDDIRDLADLRRIPFTAKDDLRKSYPYDMFAVPLRDIVRIQSTSGTTGTPVVVGYTRNDLRTWAECVARVLAAGGMTEHDVVQVAFTYGLFSGGFGLHAGAERIGASVIPASTGSLEKQVRIMKDFKTTALACTPNYALAIASAARDMGISNGELALRAGYFGAEPWSEGLRSLLEQSLGITALDNYGLTEVLGPGVSFECERKDGLHVNEDCFILEVIDPKSGETLPAGSEGELVLTTITKEGFPMLRYRTGDLGSVTREPCPCGRTLARMTRIRGRIDDMIILGATKIFPSQIEEIITAEPGLAPHFQIHLDRRDGIDTLTVLVEPADARNDAGTSAAVGNPFDRVAHRMEAVLGVIAKMERAEPGSISRAGEGKLRRVVDKRRI